MAFKLKNVQSAFKDTKTRVIFVVMLIIILIGIGIAWFGLKRAESPGAPAVATLQGVPGVRSIPGVGTPSREYVKTQEEENILRAEQAAKQGTSAIPTITRTTYIGGPSEFAQPAVLPTGAAATPDCSPEALAKARAAGVKAEELRCKGCTAAQLRAAGYTAGELMNAGFSANELKAAGFSAKELRDAGFTAAELARAGFSPAELAAAGYNAAELAQAGINQAQLTAAGVSAQQLAAAGIGVRPSNKLPKDCSVDALRQARANGVSAADIRKMGCDAAAMRAAGFTAKELKDAGFDAKELKDAGFSANELKAAGFSAGDLRQAGFSAKDLRDAGFSAKDLRGAGFSADELAAAGATAAELKAAGFSDGDLVRAGVMPTVAAAPLPPPVVTPAAPTPPPTTTLAQPVGAVPSIATPDASLVALQALQKRQEDQLSLQERQDRIAQMQQTMAGQAADLIGTWAPPPVQNYVQGKAALETTTTSLTSTTTAGGGQVSGGVGGGEQPMMIKAGDIMFAVLNTSLNSDEPSPILATIVSCPNKNVVKYAAWPCPSPEDGNCLFKNPALSSCQFRNAKLVGDFQRVDQKVILNFASMNVQSFPQSIPISAVAIDPETARTALADNVDRHILLRYGTLFASSFLNGLGNAISQSGSTTNFTLSGVSTTFQSLSPAEEALVALGETGKQFGNVLSSTFNRPPTVRVNAGQGIGILFRSDVPFPGGAPGMTTAASAPAVTPVTTTSTVVAANTANAAATTPPTTTSVTTTTSPQTQVQTQTSTQTAPTGSLLVPTS